jgi:hypothetical protein
MKMPNALHRHREQIRVLRRMNQLLALATAALLDQEPAKRRRTRGNEAPMVIGPRDVARLFRQLFTAIRGRRSD